MFNLRTYLAQGPLKSIAGFYRALRIKKYEFHWRRKVKRLLVPKKTEEVIRIYYLGVTEHSNLGDLAQYYCIGLWLRKNYPDAEIIELPSTAVVNPRCNVVPRIKSIISDRDLIFFQSGYTTQDLGGNHDLMHRIILQNFSDNKIVFMPQTVYFRCRENQEQSSRLYNLGTRTLFLARDRVSFQMAQEMFPRLKVRLFPDIVTSLIESGHPSPPPAEERIMICCRNDGEKYYTDEQMRQLGDSLNAIAPTEMSDTTISVSPKEIKRNLGWWIWKTIDDFSKYRVVVTDRYHGTIFSVIAGVPVIVLKTNDHKVVTGTGWFEGHCNGLVRLAESPEEVPGLVREVMTVSPPTVPDHYFSTEFYDRLKSIIDQDLG